MATTHASYQLTTKPKNRLKTSPQLTVELKIYQTCNIKSESMAAKGAQSVIVDLDVGGTLFRTTKLTLLSDPNSMLAKMFDPNASLVPDFLCFFYQFFIKKATI